MTPAPAPEVLEAMRAAFKQRSSQMMGDPGKLDYNAIELEAFAAAAGALAAAGWRPPVAVPEGREKEIRSLLAMCDAGYNVAPGLIVEAAVDLFALLDAARAVGFEEGARAMRNKLQADIDAERGKIVADGYDYKSGEEHGLARAVRIIRYADPAALTSAPAPEVEAMAGEGGR